MLRKLAAAAVLAGTLSAAGSAMAFPRSHHGGGGVYVGYERDGCGIKIKIPLPGRMERRWDEHRWDRGGWRYHHGRGPARRPHGW
jgi:hypothetical protein